MELGLAGRTALITGGSKGIGLEAARALAREGVKVLICARRESALAEAARDIMQTTQAKIETHPLDVTKVEQIETIPRIVCDKLGRIDILVNNAGTGTYKPFLEVTDEELVYGMAINFFAQYRAGQIGGDMALQGARQRTRAAQYPCKLRDTGLYQYAGTLCQMGA